jgi:probable F420-dependent oxidoreductase
MRDVMKIGVVYPQTEYPSDPVAIRDYAQAAEGLGFTHLLTYDHVLGANPDRPGGWSGPYTHRDPFQESFVLFAYLAAITQKIEFTTGILILPQRQTALVAKQAANLDVLCQGRLRLGVGLGWNAVEYTALNENFHNRGRRIEEQIEVLRRLWTQPLVTYKGRWHTLEDAGINPLPVQRPIPIWFGGYAEAVLRRAARLGDGWMPGVRQAAEARPALAIIHAELAAAGRDPASFGLEPRLHYKDGTPETWRATLQGWQAVGATHASFNTMGCGFTQPAQHLAAIRHFAESVYLEGQ